MPIYQNNASPTIRVLSAAGNLPISEATFVPPPVSEMHVALDNFEHFLHNERNLPILIHCGLAHAQFETIHPFLDGNGHVGRLLIAFLLVHRGVLYRPLLYLSHYLKRYRAEYYDRLMAIRDNGDWEGCLKFFLRGVAATAQGATATARSIVALREHHRDLVQEGAPGINGLRLLDLLFQRPLVNVNLVKDRLTLAFATANKLVDQFEELGLLNEITGAQRNRVYRYTPYLRLLDGQKESESETVLVQTTEPDENQ